ncbi:hypothetical protein [Streptomyces sp. enrichment culture]|uniref:hypothetical protein n=1 Tax=Streptomyces sp. enrichment culture TaxID=1795815 RepID=UPI003F550E8E
MSEVLPIRLAPDGFAAQPLENTVGLQYSVDPLVDIEPRFSNILLELPGIGTRGEDPRPRFHPGDPRVLVVLLEFRTEELPCRPPRSVRTVGHGQPP